MLSVVSVGHVMNITEKYVYMLSWLSVVSRPSPLSTVHPVQSLPLLPVPILCNIWIYFGASVMSVGCINVLRGYVMHSLCALQEISAYVTRHSSMNHNICLTEENIKTVWLLSTVYV